MFFGGSCYTFLFVKQVTVVKLPTADRNIELNWQEAHINPQSEVVLKIKWVPKEEGTWRDIVSLVDGRNVKRDIQVYFKTTVKKVSDLLIRS